MVEQDQPSQLEDLKMISDLVKEVEGFYQEGFSRQIQTRNSLIAQFLNEHIFDATFNLSDKPEELGKKIHKFLPHWKKTYHWQRSPEVTQERMRIVKNLTCQDIATFTLEWYGQCETKLSGLTSDNPAYDKLREDAATWLLVKEAAKNAVELEEILL
ncbi:hypothetical protein A3B45_03950 [Candidatus Daviesbacteria bacterium RIFCSPLOWO2_01_FULL_39_12]|uniref:Uncharacterized protein n=1 Tax=Candidatus Daviesbacteria bacterium RIFCSPLOWO2_01_FULL_39_12 TaxID=1797785 RepID=A0A1F5KU80_9BACT|nr:MAG: hypothetical protein A3B45_03950 [Candidatus Daviesbacteria bacterium RIFCSPLOWO2_01_FULL_39_12]